MTDDEERPWAELRETVSFREKSAWISVLTYLGVYGYYFWVAAGAIRTGHTTGSPFMGLLVQSMVILVVLQIVLNVIAAVARPRDAKAAMDEREKLIALKATRIAFHVIMAGTMCGIGAIAFGAPVFYSVNGLFLALVLAETVRSGGLILYYRLGG
jgi:hypothetical protein